MKSVVLKGSDIGTAVRMPDEEILVSQDGRVWLGEIDMLADQCTYRRAIIQNNTVGLRLVSFGIYLKCFSSESVRRWEYYPSFTKFPQKHIVDIEVVGANGPTGFLGVQTTSYQDGINSQEEYISDIDEVPIFIHNLLAIRDSSDKSNIDRWIVDEPDYWVNAGKYDGFPFTANQMYTRPAGLIGALGRSDLSVENYHILKGLSLLYSEQNKVIFRVIMEILSEDEKYLHVRKMTGGISLS